MNTKTFLKVFNSIETVLTGLVRTIVNIFTFAITEVAPMVAPLRVNIVEIVKAFGDAWERERGQ